MRVGARRQPGTRVGSGNADQPEEHSLSEADVPGAGVRGHAGERGDPHDQQRPGGGAVGGLVQQVDERGDGENGPAAAERAERQADQQTGRDGEDEHVDRTSVRLRPGADGCHRDGTAVMRIRRARAQARMPPARLDTCPSLRPGRGARRPGAGPAHAELVIDGDHLAARGGQQRRGQRGPVAGGSTPTPGRPGPRRSGRAAGAAGCAPPRRRGLRPIPDSAAHPAPRPRPGGGRPPAPRGWRPAAAPGAARLPTARGGRWRRRPGGRCRCGPVHAAPRRPAPGVSPSRVSGVPHGMIQPR